MLVAITSLKGGAGKTTTAIHLAAVAAADGLDVVVLDADRERSAFEWGGRITSAPFRVVAAEPNRLARQARDLSPARIVIIDTPPNDREVLKTAAAVADHVLVPVRPTGLDVNRLVPTLELLLEVEAMRGQLDVAILFTQWDSRRILSREALAALADFPVLQAKVRSLARYEQAFGLAPVYLPEYEQVWKELTSGR